jgi:hypothetical protein
VFPVWYKLNFYVFVRRNSVFKGSTWNSSEQGYQFHWCCRSFFCYRNMSTLFSLKGAEIRGGGTYQADGYPVLTSLGVHIKNLFIRVRYKVLNHCKEGPRSFHILIIPWKYISILCSCLHQVGSPIQDLREIFNVFLIAPTRATCLANLTLFYFIILTILCWA